LEGKGLQSLLKTSPQGRFLRALRWAGRPRPDAPPVLADVFLSSDKDFGLLPCGKDGAITVLRLVEGPRHMSTVLMSIPLNHAELRTKTHFPR
jgi:hypothetical protein